MRIWVTACLSGQVFHKLLMFRLIIPVINDMDWESHLLFVTFATCPFLKKQTANLFSGWSEMKGKYGITLPD